MQFSKLMRYLLHTEANRSVFWRDYPTRLSVVLTLKTPAERVWCKRTLQKLGALVSGGPSMELLAVLGPLGEQVFTQQWSNIGFKWMFLTANTLELYQDLSPGSCPRSGHSFACVEDRVTTFLQAYLGEFAPRGVFCFLWLYSPTHPSGMPRPSTVRPLDPACSTATFFTAKEILRDVSGWFTHFPPAYSVREGLSNIREPPPREELGRRKVYDYWAECFYTSELGATVVGTLPSYVYKTVK